MSSSSTDDLDLQQRALLHYRRQARGSKSLRAAYEAAGGAGAPPSDFSKLVDMADEESGDDLGVRLQELRQERVRLAFKLGQVKRRERAVEALQKEGDERKYSSRPDPVTSLDKPG